MWGTGGRRPNRGPRCAGPPGGGVAQLGQGALDLPPPAACRPAIAQRYAQLRAARQLHRSRGRGRTASSVRPPSRRRPLTPPAALAYLEGGLRRRSSSERAPCSLASAGRPPASPQPTSQGFKQHEQRLGWRIAGARTAGRVTGAGPLRTWARGLPRLLLHCTGSIRASVCSGRRRRSGLAPHDPPYAGQHPPPPAQLPRLRVTRPCAAPAAAACLVVGPTAPFTAILPAPALGEHICSRAWQQPASPAGSWHRCAAVIRRRCQAVTQQLHLASSAAGCSPETFEHNQQ